MRRTVFMLILAVTLSSVGSYGHAALINGDFSNGLTGWTSQGAVTTDNQEAVLGDNGATDSLLYQALALAPGQYTSDN